MLARRHAIEALALPAYAKLNYTLDVLSRRPDGYHNLASVMQAVSLSDDILLTRLSTPGVALECEDPSVPAGPANLAWRAAEAVLAAAGSPAGLRIRLEKRIPLQAGLGGGSSDAAAVLRGADFLLELGLGRERLVAIAAQIGSDVPFFLTGGTASVRGMGEAVTPLPDGPEFWFTIAKPAGGVSTAWAYAALDAIPGRVSARATRRMEEDVAAGNRDRILAGMVNDFEQVVLPEHLAVALLHDDMMMSRARAARLCGSGSAVFGVSASRLEAEDVARMLRLKYPTIFVCRAVGRRDSLAFGTVVVRA